MKLTKSKLKQIIKEELEANPLPWWMKMTDDLLAKAQDMFRQAPPPGKEYMINNFETYILQWKEEMEPAGSPDDDYTE